MASVLDIVAEARSAASRSWDRARQVLAKPAGPDPASLARFIETDIVPQLLLAHREAPMGAPTRTGAIAPDIADAFARACLDEEVAPLLARVETLLAAGIGVETVYLHLLAPAARRLGEWWEEDSCDFVHVTMGLWRLQELVHALGALVPGRAPDSTAPRRILLTPIPGDQHSFGIVMVEEFFRRAGWSTWSAPCLDEDELLTLLAGRHFDVLALSVSVDQYLKDLPSLIALLRQASRNSEILVMVGGRPFIDDPARALALGADATAADGRAAVTLAESLLTKRLRAGVTHSI